MAICKGPLQLQEEGLYFEVEAGTVTQGRDMRPEPLARHGPLRSRNGPLTRQVLQTVDGWLGGPAPKLWVAEGVPEG